MKTSNSLMNVITRLGALCKALAAGLFSAKALPMVALLAAVNIAWAAEIVIWHGYRGQEKDALEKVARMFEAAYPDSGITIKTLAVPYDAYADKITAAVPRGKGPDIFIFAQDRLGGWVETGNTVEPIDFYLDDETLDMLLPGMIEAMTYQDSVYGLPLNFKSIALIYNKDIIDTPPQTSGELVDLAEQHTDQAIGKFGLAYSYNNFFYHAALFNGFGAAVFDADGNPTLASPEAVDSLDLMMEWYKQDGVLPAEPSSALVNSLFNSGKAAIVFDGPWFIGEVADSVNYGIAVLPTLDEADGAPMRPWLTIEGAYISAGSQHKEDSYEVLKYLVGINAGEVLAVEGRQLHTNTAVYDLAAVADDPVLAGFRKQLDTAVAMPNLAEMTLVWSPVTTAMNTIVKGGATPTDAMQRAQESVEKDIAALRKGR